MANKFQKSVQERLEQEAARQKKHTQRIAATDAGASEKPMLSNAIPEQSKPKSQSKPKKETVQSITSLPDITMYLKKEPQRLAKNKTFYLDSDVIDAIKKIAKQQGITDSKLVNDVLRKVLSLG